MSTCHFFDVSLSMRNLNKETHFIGSGSGSKRYWFADELVLQSKRSYLFGTGHGKKMFWNCSLSPLIYVFKRNIQGKENK